MTIRSIRKNIDRIFQLDKNYKLHEFCHFDMKLNYFKLSTSRDDFLGDQAGDFILKKMNKQTLTIEMQ